MYTVAPSLWESAMTFSSRSCNGDMRISCLLSKLAQDLSAAMRGRFHLLLIHVVIPRYSRTCLFTVFHVIVTSALSANINPSLLDPKKLPRHSTYTASAK